MSESQSLLLESANRVFADLGEDSGAAWAKVAELGFDGLLAPEEQGGFGGDWADAFAVVARLGAVQAAPVALGEAIVAAHLAARAGFARLDGMQTIAAHAEGRLDGKGRFTGRIAAAPWGGEATSVLVDLDDAVVRMATADARVERRANPAGEPRDTLVFEAAPAERGEAGLSAFAAGAFIRTAQIAGALDAALAMSIQYANERNQFGKPIGKFQAVQQNLAVFAEEAAAVNSAGQAAAQALDLGEAGFEIAAAKLRANMAAGVCGAIAHQVHGAMGFTQEHALHRFTRRLISWRSEFGGEHHWANDSAPRSARGGRKHFGRI